MNEIYTQVSFENVHADIEPHVLGGEIAQALENRYPSFAEEFMCVFSHESDEGAVSLAAVGCQFQIESKLEENHLRISLLHGGSTEQEVCYSLDLENYHEQVFLCMSSFIEGIRPLLFAQGLPPETFLLGGWKCATDPVRVGEPLVFTIPRILCKVTKAACDFGYFKDKDSSIPPLDASLVCFDFDFKLVANPRILSQKEHPECGEYVDALVDLITELSRESADKVVIGREVRMMMDREVSPVRLLRLVAAHRRQHYEYVFRWSKGDAWIGISPETLLRKRNGLIVVEPLAGTRKGSEAKDKGSRYRQELLSDQKEIEEHDTAANMFHENLRDVCMADSLEVLASKEVLDLGYVQHLKSKITGRVRPDMNVFNVLGAVYPPATIWGKPVALSGQRIRRYERIDRGFYAGGLGFFSLADDANFALAIRTARMSGRQLHVYAGSGIVKGSDPYREWLETTNKMGPFIANEFVVALAEVPSQNSEVTP